MDARLQTRIQRYGWDLAADDYEPLWGPQLAGVHRHLLDAAALAPGQRVLDVACGTGHIARQAAQAVGPLGSVLGVGLQAVGQRRLSGSLSYGSGDEACRAAFLGGPVALAWSRFSEDVRQRVRAGYLDAISTWRLGTGYSVPAEFVIVTASFPLRPGDPSPGRT